MRTRKGFTLAELVVTIGVIALGSVMAVSIIISMIKVQDTTNALNQRAEELANIDSLCSNFASYISVKNDDFDFTYDSDSCTSKKITYSQSTYSYSLEYNDSPKTLSIVNDYDGEIDYLKYSKSIEIHFVSDISMRFEQSISLLIVDVTLQDKVNHYSYIIRG